MVYCHSMMLDRNQLVGKYHINYCKLSPDLLKYHLRNMEMINIKQLFQVRTFIIVFVVLLSTLLLVLVQLNTQTFLFHMFLLGDSMTPHVLH